VLEFVATVQLAVLINVPSPFDLATAFVIESALIMRRVREKSYLAVACMIILPVISGILHVLT
jgi:hypothetical protein